MNLSNENVGGVKRKIDIQRKIIIALTSIIIVALGSLLLL